MENEILKPEEFYKKAVEAFHGVAADLGLVKKGPILVEELSSLGDKTALQFLTDKFVIKQFGKDPRQFYYAVNNTCFMAGVVFGDNWFRQGKKLDRDFADDVIVASPQQYAMPILRQQMGLSDETLKPFLSRLYGKWLELLEEYWNLPDSKSYVIKLMAASYQTGLSLVLDPCDL